MPADTYNGALASQKRNKIDNGSVGFVRIGPNILRPTAFERHNPVELEMIRILTTYPHIRKIDIRPSKFCIDIRYKNRDMTKWINETVNLEEVQEACHLFRMLIDLCDRMQIPPEIAISQSDLLRYGHKPHN